LYGYYVQICYIDESGDEQPLIGREAPPVLVIAGLVVAEASRRDLIWDYLQVKKRFERQCSSPSYQLSELIAHEIKGSDLRADLRKGRRRSVRRAIGILDSVVEVLVKNHATLVGYVHIKRDGQGPRAGVYPDAIAKIAEQFEAQLRAADTNGIMILDARTKVKNVPSVQTITTRQFKSGGDSLPHLAESPVFGHSDTHVILQVADLVASALLFPMACSAYCQDVSGNAHPHKGYDQLRGRYGERLRKMEHRYVDDRGERRGGVIVFDTRNRRPSLDLFAPPRPQQGP
jgi:hypothetical protein